MKSTVNLFEGRLDDSLEKHCRAAGIEPLALSQARALCAQAALPDEAAWPLCLFFDRLSSGDVCLDRDGLAAAAEQAAALLTEAGLEVVPAVPAGIDSLFDTDWPRAGGMLVNDNGRLYTSRYHDYEESLAALVSRRLQKASSWDVDNDSCSRLLKQGPLVFGAITPSEGQVEAWQNVLQKPFSVVCGGPGTGKTTLIMSVLRGLLLHHMNEDRRPRVLLAAPTGRAAFRVRESLEKAAAEAGGLLHVHEALPRECHTIHKLLSFGRSIGQGPRRNRDNRLACDVLILDESSMVDQRLLVLLLEAIDEDTKVILLGDPFQLPSVDSGQVLRDIYNTAGSLDAVCELTAVQRARGQLRRFVGIMQQGNRQAFNRFLKEHSETVSCEVSEHSRILQELEGFYDFNRLQTGSRLDFWPDSRQEAVLTTALQEGGALPAWVELWQAEKKKLANVFDLLDSAVILCPWRVGELGSNEINRYLVSAFKPFNYSAGPAAGIPVMINRNDYDLMLFNGDRGVLVSLGGSLYAAFRRGSNEDIKLVALERISGWEYAFAISVHKSQGSEYERLLLVAARDRWEQVSREMVYTAITRAKESVSIRGADGPVVWSALERSLERSSGLTGRLLKPV